MSERLIEADRSIVWAADVEPSDFSRTLQSLGGIGLGGIKVGFELGLLKGLPSVVNSIRLSIPETVVIYDHQKAGNDIPDTGENFARTMKAAGVDAAILFPFTGTDVQRQWTHELQDVDIVPIVGAEMTHHGINDRIQDRSFEDIYRQAINDGVTNFVVPGTKPESIKGWRELFEQDLGIGNFILFSPGFKTQGGSIEDAMEVAGRVFHPIVGRGIHGAEDPRQAVIDMTAELGVQNG